MKTDEEINALMDAAEIEIKAVLKKYDLQLGMLYDEGVAITLFHEQNNDNGTIHMFSREAF